MIGRGVLIVDFAACEIGNPAAKHIRQRPQERNLGAIAISEQIHTWLHECTHIHDDPPNTKALNYRMPTRVIDVGVDDGESVRLFEPPQTMREEYVALSYCWGDISFIMTQLKNIDDHRTALVVSELPQTFKDAIATTRSLRFRYIWIDALCIIQDSREDQDKELSAMRDIYSFAKVTITAVCAGSVFDGFLDAKPQLSVELPFACLDGEMGSVLVAPQKVTDLWQQRLYTRAWCLQENLLSPRVLLFCDGDVVWQCQTTPFRRIDNNNFDYGEEDATFRTSPFRRLPGSIFSEGRIPYSPIKVSGSITNNPETELKTWKCTVENYTRRRLTYLPDRLPALAGVAEKFQKTWTDEYLAGLWKRHFILLLAWRRNQDHPIVYFEPLQSYRAPTWSWASIEGPIEYDRVTPQSSAQKVEAKFVSCFVSLVNASLPFGQVQSARLKLEVSMVPWSRTAGAHDKRGQGHSATWDAMERPTQETMDALWDMFLCEGGQYAGKSKESFSLVLSPVEGEEDTFRRVGFSVWTVGWNWKPWSRVPRRTITIV
ncbi:heterokaryon incompatibility protein-domain-containing protein [Halenospora varia]|nr:heterokaryon incompatibility protein-domain-containing protein [Halenospora varia]